METGIQVKPGAQIKPKLVPQTLADAYFISNTSWIHESHNRKQVAALDLPPC